MKTNALKTTAALCAALVAATIATPSTPARADVGLDAALGALAGAIVGGLLFDSSRNQYYYVQGGRRDYVSNSQAQQYYQRRDPSYFNAHRGTFNKSHGQFANNWNHDHPAGHR